MKNKYIAILLSCIALVGCASGQDSSMEKSSLQESSYFIRGFHTYDGVMGFTNAIVGPEGTFSPTDKITLDVFYGRGRELRWPDFYDEYQGCDFSLQVQLICIYYDKRGKDKVVIDDLEINIGTIVLPDLMDEEYVFENDYPELRHSLQYTLDLSLYYQNFINAIGYCSDYEDENYCKEIEVDLDRTEVTTFFEFVAEKDGEIVPLGATRVAYNLLTVKNGIIVSENCVPSGQSW